jgi:hypothetical protein
MRGNCKWAAEEVWVFEAYIFFNSLPVVRMRFVEMSGIYMRIDADHLVHIRNILLVLSSFDRGSC